MNKKVIVGLCVLLIVVLLVPIPVRLKDGGTVLYNAILFKIEDVHRLSASLESEQAYQEGIIIRILGVKVFDNVK